MVSKFDTLKYRDAAPNQLSIIRTLCVRAKETVLHHPHHTAHIRDYTNISI